jgi:flagellar motility protein MotE (MotC chaperone)
MLLVFSNEKGERKMKKLITSSMIAVFAMFLILLSADVASAQPRWARGRQRVAVNQTIRRLETETDRFSREINRSLDNSRRETRRREDRIEDSVRDLENATDELRREFDRRGDTWWETRENVSKVVAAARSVNRLMRDRRLNNMSGNSWQRVQREINTLAGYYGLPRV